jgi:LSD1 subclass zinc finger protein
MHVNIDTHSPGPAAVPATTQCPSCRVTLRVPEGAEIIRCPRCKTEIDVSPAGPPRPTVAIPLEPRPVARPVERPTAPPQTVVRAEPAAPIKPGGTSARERMLAEREDEQERLLEALDLTARPARTGMALLAYGAVASCAASVFYFIGQVMTFAVPELLPLVLLLCAGLLGLHWLLTTAGFGYCAFGPKPMRPMAAGGVAVQVLYVALLIPLLLTVTVLINLQNVGFGNLNGRDSLIATLLLSNLFNNLSTVTDLPVYLISGALDRPQVTVLPILGGMFEFAKLCLMGLLTHNYCMMGKDPELAYQGLRFVYRLFWVVILGTVLKVALFFLIKLTGGEPLLLVWFAIPMMFVTNGYFLWCAFAWYSQCRVMLDAIEVIDPRRFADSRQRLDVV